MTYLMDSRYLLLQDWLKNILAADFTIKPLAGDASFRRYFRILQNDRTFVAMDAPPTHEDILPFITIANILEKSQVRAPHIYERNLEQGFLLLSDLGDNLLLQALNGDTVNHLYQEALATLHRIQNCEPGQATLPAFDKGMILRELSLFVEWFLEKHLGLALNHADKQILEKTFQSLIQSAEEQPQLFVHRDYHSRNLLWMPNQEIGVIDFQDAVLGPITYDLISLVRDCYIAWPQETVTHWILQFQQEALAQKKLHETSPERFLKWTDWMGVQRHLKAIGIFSRLNHRDQKPHYLNDIPRTLNYVRYVTQRYPELTTFNTWLEDRVLTQNVTL